MTWAKYGVEFWDELAEAELSDAAARTHAEAIAYLYRIESDDLVVKRVTLRRFAGTADPGAAMAELVAAELWCPVAGGWQLVHHDEVVRQSLAAQLANREKTRERVRRHRNKHTQGLEPVTESVTRYETRDVPQTQTDRQTDKQKDATRGEVEERQQQRTNRPQLVKQPDPGVDPWAVEDPWSSDRPQLLEDRPELRWLAR